MPWPEFATLFGANPRRIEWGRAGFVSSLPLLDCGSGVGEGVVALAEAFPASRVIAVEPDPAMRVALMCRVSSVPGLVRRVTVHPVALDRVPIQGRLGGVVATGFFYFLPPQLREQAWRLFAQHLTGGSGVVFEKGDAPDPVDDEPERLLGTRWVGDLRYERWFSQRPAGDGSVTITNTFRVWDDDRLVYEDVAPCTTWPLTNARTIEECKATGAFDVEELNDGYMIARRR